LRKDLCIIIWGVECHRWILFNPEILWRLEIVAEDRYDFLYLLICILINEKVEMRSLTSFLLHDLLVLKGIVKISKIRILFTFFPSQNLFRSRG
jgi:hypothetical protein